MEYEVKIMFERLIDAMHSPTNTTTWSLFVSGLNVVVSGTLTYYLIRATNRIGKRQNEIQSQSLKIQCHNQTYELYDFSYRLASFSNGIFISIPICFALKDFETLRNDITEIKVRYERVLLLSDVVLREPYKTHFQNIAQRLSILEKTILSLEKIATNSELDYSLQFSNLSNIDLQIAETIRAIKHYSEDTTINEFYVETIIEFRGWLMIVGLHNHIRKICDISDIII